jgi:hypothetical protein
LVFSIERRTLAHPERDAEAYLPTDGLRAVDARLHKVAAIKE